MSFFVYQNNTTCTLVTKVCQEKNHYCPNVVWNTFCNYLNTMKFNHKFFFDTNSRMSHTSSSSQKEMAHGYWETYLCPSHGFSAGLRIPSMRSTIPRSLQDEKLFMSGPVSLHGLRTAHLSREPSRYCGLPSFGPTKTLSHGYSGHSLPQYPSSREPSKRLTNLCRLRPDPLGRARSLYVNDSFGVELNQTAYALDSTLIDLCLSLFPWAKFRNLK